MRLSKRLNRTNRRNRVSFLKFIPLKWKVGLLFGGFGLLLLVAITAGSIAYAMATAKAAGTLQCENAGMVAAVKSLEQAREEYLDAVAELYETENIIDAAPDSDDGNMSRVLVDQLNRM